MRKYYAVYTNSGELVNVVEEPFEVPLPDYLLDLKSKGFTYKEISHFKYRVIQDYLWKRRFKSAEAEAVEMRKTYVIAAVPSLLKVVIVLAILNLIIISL